MWRTEGSVRAPLALALVTVLLGSVVAVDSGDNLPPLDDLGKGAVPDAANGKDQDVPGPSVSKEDPPIEILGPPSMGMLGGWVSEPEDEEIRSSQVSDAKRMLERHTGVSSKEDEIGGLPPNWVSGVPKGSSARPIKRHRRGSPVVPPWALSYGDKDKPRVDIKNYLDLARRRLEDTDDGFEADVDDDKEREIKEALRRKENAMKRLAKAKGGFENSLTGEFDPYESDYEDEIDLGPALHSSGSGDFLPTSSAEEDPEDGNADNIATSSAEEDPEEKVPLAAKVDAPLAPVKYETKEATSGSEGNDDETVNPALEKPLRHRRRRRRVRHKWHREVKVHPHPILEERVVRDANGEPVPKLPVLDQDDLKEFLAMKLQGYVDRNTEAIQKENEEESRSFSESSETEWTDGDNDILLDTVEPGLTNEHLVLSQLESVKKLFKKWASDMPAYRVWQPYLLDMRDLVQDASGRWRDVDEEATKSRMQTLALMRVDAKKTGVRAVDFAIEVMERCVNVAKEAKEEFLYIMSKVQKDKNNLLNMALQGDGATGTMTGLSYYTYSLFLTDQISLKAALLATRLRGWNGDPSDWTGTVQGRLTQIIWIVNSRIKRYEAILTKVELSDEPKLVMPARWAVTKAGSALLKEQQAAVLELDKYIPMLREFSQSVVVLSGDISSVFKGLKSYDDVKREYNEAISKLWAGMERMPTCLASHMKDEDLEAMLVDEVTMFEAIHVNEHPVTLKCIISTLARRHLSHDVLLPAVNVDIVRNKIPKKSQHLKFNHFGRKVKSQMQTLAISVMVTAEYLNSLRKPIVRSCGKKIERYRLNNVDKFVSKVRNRLMVALQTVLKQLKAYLIPSLVGLLDAVCTTRLERNARELQHAGEYSLTNA